MLLSCSSNMLVITCKHDKYFTSLCVCVCTLLCPCVCVGRWKNAITLCCMLYRSLFWFFLSFFYTTLLLFRKIVFYKLYREIIPAVYPSVPTLPCICTLGSHIFIFFIFWESFCVCFSLSSQRWWFSMPHYFWLPECRNLHRPFKFLCLLLPRVCDLAKHSEDVAAFHNITENPTYTMLYLVLHNFSYFYFHRNITFWKIFLSIFKAHLWIGLGSDRILCDDKS